MSTTTVLELRAPAGLRARVWSRLEAILCACLIGLGSCASDTVPMSDLSSERETIPPAKLVAADFQIVDCKLPPKLRRIGGRIYFEPQRPARTTGRDCGIRGGDAVLYDPANYATALQIWEPLAEAGDARAQTYLGQIYETGLDGSPNYTEAGDWYRRAAEQGYASAKVSLGQLYERGLGVPKDMDAALDLYRQASGLSEPLEFIPAAELTQLRQQAGQGSQEIAALRRELESLRRERDEAQSKLEVLQRSDDAQADQASAEVGTLRQEADRLEHELADARAALREREQSAEAGADQESAEADALRQQIDRLHRQLDDAQSELEAHRQTATQRTQYEIEALNSLLHEKDTQIAEKEEGLKRVTSIDFGNYYALVIGINSYQNNSGLEPLESAVLDASMIAAVLQNKYHYKVNSLPNARRDEILDALNILKRELGPNDNLLIYYAGHGFLDEETGRGYWIPADAEAAPMTTKWISNTDITDILQSMQAKHVLVVADSCYAGSLGKAGGALLERVPQEERVYALSAMANIPARLVLTSGDLSPVPDGAGGKHSIFASAILQELGTIAEVMEGWRLYLRVSAHVADAVQLYDVRQVPTYREIESERYQGGDFFFVPEDA
jgi:uncharacterized protein